MNCSLWLQAHDVHSAKGRRWTDVAKIGFMREKGPRDGGP